MNIKTKISKQLNQEDGITLTTLVIYIVIFFIVITIMTVVSAFFHKNVAQVKEPPQYIAEFNKFAMFFVIDVKNNNDATFISDNEIQFEDGTIYRYEDNSIYRNEVQIARFINNFKFEKKEYTENNFTKKIVNVNAKLGREKNYIRRNIDFVMKYW